MDREHFISNVAGHLGKAKSAQIKERQRTSCIRDMLRFGQPLTLLQSLFSLR